MIEPYIETVTGKKVYFLKPEPEMFEIEDIAHALSNTCRFTGHTSRFYSVAEHSRNVSSVLPVQYSLTGLLHDASEAYLTDVASPVKPHLGNYREIENGLMLAIAKRFGIDWPVPKEVHEADLRMLMTEAFWLIPSQGKDWEYYKDVVKYPGFNIVGHDPKRAKREFLDTFYALTGRELRHGTYY